MQPYYLEAIVIVIGLFLLMVESFAPKLNKRTLGWFGVIGLIIALAALIITPVQEITNSHEMAHFYTYDKWARFFKGFALVSTIIVLILSIDYQSVLKKFSGDGSDQHGTGEFFSLPLFACAGMMWLASARDLVSMFVALEVVTITFYILVAFMRRNVGSLEAGVKYLILGALSTGFLVYGISWIYGATQSTTFSGIAQALQSDSLNPQYALFGVALVLLALAFKTGAVPMHLWIPDVYQGAPTPTTAFLSVGSKAAGFAVALRFLQPFLDADATKTGTLFIILVMAIATLLVGNLGALAQTNFKRLLAYSSISHAGFILLAVAAWNQSSDDQLSSAEVVAFYLSTYLIMTMAAFFILVTVSKASDSDEIDAFNGLGQRAPFLALCLTIILAAMAGLPLTAGFLGKLFVFQLAAGAQLWWGLAAAIIGAAAGFYYYFKTIKALYWENAETDAPAIALPLVSKIAVITLTALTIVFGFYPAPILSLFS